MSFLLPKPDVKNFELQRDRTVFLLTEVTFFFWTRQKCPFTCFFGHKCLFLFSFCAWWSLFFFNGIWARSECARCSLFFCLVSEPGRGAPGALFFVFLDTSVFFPFLFVPGGLFFLNGIWARLECARFSLFFFLLGIWARSGCSRCSLFCLFGVWASFLFGIWAIGSARCSLFFFAKYLREVGVGQVLSVFCLVTEPGRSVPSACFFLLGILRQVRGVPAVGEKRVVKEKLTFE